MKTLFITLFGTFLACSDGGNSSAKYAAADEADWSEMEEFVVESNYSEDQDVKTDDTKIIKTADIEFATRDMDATYLRVRKAIAATGGNLQDDNTGKSYNQVYRNLVIRVPSANFETLVDSIGQGVDYFDTKRISRRDVGEEFVDLQARLKAKRKLEERYLQLLSKAKNVKEMLEIERELASIREEIEAKQGRLNYLQSQVSMSTISLRFYKETVEAQAQVSFGSKIANALKGGWNGLLTFFIGVLYLWPFLLVVGLVFFIIRSYLKRSKRSANS